MKPTKKLVVIVPAHNEEANLELLVRQVCAVEVPGWETELLIVDDGSTDGSLEKLRGLRSAGWPVGLSASPVVSGSKRLSKPDCATPMATR
jgi:cellulose synthase/poly-beta-1,6-N-acetylglucosamine synthase-like glycosyltransferase